LNGTSVEDIKKNTDTLSNKGKKALVLKAIPNADHVSGTGLVATHSGLSLHAGVAVAGGERKKLEKLARYIARPPIAQDRLRLSEQGEVVYELKKFHGLERV